MRLLADDFPDVDVHVAAMETGPPLLPKAALEGLLLACTAMWGIALFTHGPDQAGPPRPGSAATDAGAGANGSKDSFPRLRSAALGLPLLVRVAREVDVAPA